MNNHIEKAVFPVTEATLGKVQEQLTEGQKDVQKDVSDRIPSIRVEGMPYNTSVKEVTTTAGISIVFMNDGRVKLIDKWHEFNVILNRDDVYTLEKCLGWVWRMM